jgi:hypothetical protein
MDITSIKRFVTVEETQMGAADSNSLALGVGQALNWILDNISAPPVGTIVHSLLTEAQFQAAAGAGWILCDGRNVAGSLYHTTTGKTNVPDFRACYARGKAAAEGDINLGTFGTDINKSHTHVATPTRNELARTDGANTRYNFAGGPTPRQFKAIAAGGSIQATVSTNGGNEFRPWTSIANILIRIN